MGTKKEQDQSMSPSSLQPNKDLSEIYYNPADPGSYGSAKNLYESAKNKGKKIDLKSVSKWLLFQKGYTRHKYTVRRFPRRRVIRIAPLDVFVCDLIDVQSLRKENSNVGYIFVLVDLFSLMAFVRTLKHKTLTEMEAAYESVFDDIGVVPVSIWSDRGSEMVGLTKLYNRYKINHYAVNSDLHCTIVERWNQTLQKKLYRVMTARNTLRYVDFLQDVVDSINHRKSRALFNLTPFEVWNNVNKQLWLRKKFSALENKVIKRPKLKVNDLVRIALPHNKFTRSYKPAFSEEIYRIKHIDQYNVPVYELDGKRRKFYEPELVKVGTKEGGEGEEEEEEKRDHGDPLKNSYFIERERNVGSGSLRSGRQRTTEKEYLLKNHNDDSLKTWINEQKFREMVKSGLLSAP